LAAGRHEDLAPPDSDSDMLSDEVGAEGLGNELRVTPEKLS
jgi:hypothetical protein